MNFILLHAADGDRPLRVNLDHVIWYAPSGVGYGDSSTRIVTLDGKHLYVRESADQLDGHCSGRAPLIEEYTLCEECTRRAIAATKRPE